MLISVLISILGILFIFNPFSLNPDIKGILLAIASAVTFSLYGVISKTRINKYGGLILNCFSFIIGDIILLLCLLGVKKPILTGITSTNIWHILYLGIFVTALGYLSYFEAMKLTSAITASMVFLIKPALAPILSFLILGEIIKINTMLGIACIILGALIVFFQNKKGQEDAKSISSSKIQ
jgi:drug/metabolite transporter (DMT)-like permease